MDLITKAAYFAREAHKDQKRKYTGEPYFTHLANVATLVKWAKCNDEMIAAAYLHDTLEDTHVQLSQIVDEFGYNVALYVDELTDKFTKESHPDLNRKERKERERERMRHVSNNAKTIKLADLIDNSSDIAQNDPGFAKVYLNEKEALLPLLEGGNKDLWHNAWSALWFSKEKLGMTGKEQ